MWLNQTGGVQASNKTTLSVTTNSKVDCAKECPCGVPTIPVPDQWLEVMVTGGFKVWHIIFIIIAFIVTMVVIYCCFHRCRIPRTKQEIEADLMRSNLGQKFRDYLQELPNEPLTFTEALKKVQEIEEKLEQDDAQLSRELGARKRMGWIKLKGKGDKDAPDKDKDKEAQDAADKLPTDDTTIKPSEKDEAAAAAANETSKANGLTKLAADQPATGSGPQTKLSNGQLRPSDTEAATNADETNKKEVDNNKHQSGGKTENAGDQDKSSAARTNKDPAAPKRRRQKPNLSRTKLAKERPLLVESGDNLERPPVAERSSHLELPDPTIRKPTGRGVHKRKTKLDKNQLDENPTSNADAK